MHWEFENGGKFEEYPDKINMVIEKAYGVEDRAEWDEKVEGRRITYRIDFKKNVETELDDPRGGEVRVRRVVKGSTGTFCAYFIQ